MTPANNRRSALEEEKKTILQELARHAKADPNIRERFHAIIEDIGTEIDDAVYEVEQHTVDSALVETLVNRLEDITEELKTTS